MNCKGCVNGVKMCHHRPCFGTPEEFEKIIDAGFAEKLRIDYYVGRQEVDWDEICSKAENEDLKKSIGFLKELQDLMPNPFREDVLMLSGATEKDKNYHAPFMPTGTCALLENDLCTLHDLGLKPEQGRESCCNDEHNTAKRNEHYAHLWNTEKGKEIIEKFKKAVNYVEDSSEL